MDELLQVMLDDMRAAPKAYQPTNFWSSCSPKITAEIEKRGLSCFRRHSSGDYYVPTYASHGYLSRRAGVERVLRVIYRLLSIYRGGRRARRMLEPLVTKALSGEMEALADYRVFLAAETDAPPRLGDISESRYGEPFEQFTFDDKHYSRAFLNYLRGLAFLKKVVDPGAIRTVAEIGGGYGTLGEILLKCEDADFFYVNVDIPPVAYVSTHYLRQLFGRDKVCDYLETRKAEAIDLADLARRFRAVVLCPWQLPRVQGRVDLFVNFISFQEMEREVVANYASYINALTAEYVLLRNSRAGKRVAKEPGKVGVIEPVTRDHYLRFLEPFQLVAVDSLAFGSQLPGVFESEVLVFRRKASRGASPTDG